MLHSWIDIFWKNNQRNIYYLFSIIVTKCIRTITEKLIFPSRLSVVIIWRRKVVNEDLWLYQKSRQKWKETNQGIEDAVTETDIIYSKERYLNLGHNHQLLFPILGQQRLLTTWASSSSSVFSSHCIEWCFQSSFESIEELVCFASASSPVSSW